MVFQRSRKIFVLQIVPTTVTVLIILGIIFVLHKCFYTLGTHYREQSHTEVFPTNTTIMPPCGDICNYNITDNMYVEIQKPNKMPKTYLKKAVNCRNMLLRMKNAAPGILPPPKRPPPELKQAFEQNGEMPITKYWYFGRVKEGPKTSFAKGDIDSYIDKIKLGKPIGPYKDAVIGLLLKKYRSFLEGTRGIVFGTLTPWLEAHLLHVGVKHVTTVDYNRISLDHPQLTFRLHTELVDEYLQSNIQFDFAASYSSLEHAGLGRYGDPFNPYGDLEASAQIGCLLRPGGLFFFGAYVGKMGNNKSEIHWNAHRIYGPQRLRHFGANWILKDAGFKFAKQGHQTIVYEKPPL